MGLSPPAEFWGGLGQNSDKHLNSEWPPHSHFAKQNSARPDCLQTAICATGRILLRLTPKLHAEASVERSGNCWKISHRQIADCRLQIADCRFQMAGHSKSVPPRLQISDCEEQPHPGFSSPTSPITPHSQSAICNLVLKPPKFSPNLSMYGNQPPILDEAQNAECRLWCARRLSWG